MKQTVEEAAAECRQAIAEALGPDAQYHFIDECPNHGLSCDMLVEESFIAGAEWQAKQSPWISAEEQLPEDDKQNIIKTNSGLHITKDVLAHSDEFGYVVCCRIWRDEGWYWAGFEKPGCVTRWMYIPTFDQILEANKDVLQRMKEKGD